MTKFKYPLVVLAAIGMFLAGGSFADATGGGGGERSDGATTAAVGPQVSELRTVAITPCRILDTRAGGGGRLAGGVARNYNARGATITGQGGSANCNIPASAEAIEGNITAVNPGSGFIRVEAFDGTPAIPAGTVVNYAGSGITNATTIPLCVGGGCSKDFSINTTGGSSDIVIDVTAYKVPPMYALIDGDGDGGSSAPELKAAKRMGSLVDIGTGIYRVSTTDGTDIRGCSIQATPGISDTNQFTNDDLSAQFEMFSTSIVEITVSDDTGALVDSEVTVLVSC